MQERIFELMKKQGVSQYMLAKTIGVSEGNISDWKKGRTNPSADALSKIADYFNVSVDYLLGRTQSPRLSAIQEKFDRLNPQHQSNLLMFADIMLENDDFQIPASFFDIQPIK